MPPPLLDLGAISSARLGLNDTAARLNDNNLALARAEARRALLLRMGDLAGAGNLAAEMERLRAESLALSRRTGELGLSIREHSNFLAALDPANLVAALDGHFPVMLLPVRLETRFFANATELRVRIFPDTLHIDEHEPELTEPEVEGGRWYWKQRWLNGADVSRNAAAWNELIKRFRPPRAAWVVRALTPTNLAALGAPAGPTFPEVPLKAAAWTRPARAVFLPDRWVVIGYAGTKEIFRKWTGHVPDSLAVTPTPGPRGEAPAPGPEPLLIDDPMRWLVNYDEAVNQGMAVTVTNADLAAGHQLAQGLERLLVFGVDWTLAPEQVASNVTALVRSHLYSDTLAFLPGGVPTNNTAAANLAPDVTGANLDPAQAVPPLHPTLAGPLFCSALGVNPDDLPLSYVPGATLAEQRTAAEMTNALWQSTLGYYLDQMMDPVLDDNNIGLVRDHAIRHLRPGGPLPLLRVGPQPYGVLPVVAAGRFRSSIHGRFEEQLHGFLMKLRWHWRLAGERAPRLGRGGSIDDTMLKILQMSPLAAQARFREVFGPGVVSNTEGRLDHAILQARVTDMLRPFLGWPQKPRLASFTVDAKNHPLPVPWVQGGPLSETEPLKEPYIRLLATLTSQADGRDKLSAQEDAATLLHALLAHSAVEEIDRSVAALIHQRHLALGVITSLPSRLAFRTPEMVRLDAPVAPAAAGVRPEVTIASPREQAKLILPAINATMPLAEFVSRHFLEAAFRETPEFRTLAGFRASLDWLADRPSAELDRAFRGLLDACSHRLDAWFTSLATRRLADVRAGQPRGVHVGGYGWVEELRPDTRPDSLGYVHTPSLAHAATAAILRSGHLAHQDAEHQALNIDLSSERVRQALLLLDGVAQDQPLAALLGYRLERGLRERGLTFARFILPIRRLAPLRAAGGAQPAEPAESIAARDVVDGVALLERWRKDGPALLNTLSATPAEQQVLQQELNALADALDAVNDVLTAETVFQTVRGNPERAAAAASVLDKQAGRVDPQVVRTPRSGSSYVQRVLVLLGAEPLPAAWAAVPADLRATTEPLLNAWVARLIGAPDRYHFAATLTIKKAGQPDEIKPLTLSLLDLKLPPLALVYLSGPGGSGRPSELLERLAQAFAAQVIDATPESTLQLSPAPPADAGAEAIGLGAFQALLDLIRDLLTRHRPADARDLVLPADGAGPGIDVADLRQRADAAVLALDGAIAALGAALAAGSPVLADLQNALAQALTIGARGAMTLQAFASPEAEQVGALIERCGAVQATLISMRKRISAAETGLAAATAPVTDLAQVLHHAERIKLVLGKDFTVLPRFTLPAAAAAELGASLADQAALSGDNLAANAWLQQLAPVRSGVNALASVLTAFEVLTPTTDSPDSPRFEVAQLPHAPGQRWAALPSDRATEADAAFVVHAPSRVDPSQPLAGLMVDEWTEIIPAGKETTGLTFHYDAPAARPPQTILLAVPPDLSEPNWSFDALRDTLLETLELAQFRLAAPQHIDLHGSILPMVYLPQNFTRDVPSVDFSKLVAKAQVHLTGRFNVLGKV